MARKQTAEVVVPEAGNALVHPATGEVIDLDNPDECAVALVRFKVLRDEIGDAEQMLKRSLMVAAEKEGVTSTLKLPSAEVVFSHPSELHWDLEILKDLQAAGLPEHRYNELVRTTVEEKVSATVANQLEKANPRYAVIIDQARTRIPKATQVSVKLRPDS